MSDNRNARELISQAVASIKPHDALEQEHISDITSWVASGVEIFRIQKDATPPKHLVSYSLVVDIEREKVLLFDHKRAQLMLPSGGHIDVNELPADAAKRELLEELGLSLDLVTFGDSDESIPFFATVTNTVGISEPHTDVSLWYLFNGDSTKELTTDGDEYSKEFEDFHWLSFDEVLNAPINKFDPHMHRVLGKIKSRLPSLSKIDQETPTN